MVSMQMEENSPSPQPSPTPQCVGREFIRQYYTLLAEAPQYVHRFYSNESIFVHGSDTEEIVGQLAIQNKIRELCFEECRTRIRALDAHETLGKGVVVQVVGEISVNGGSMRRFVQTFVLAPQSEKKYYVHNDIFRYEDELFVEKLAQENGAPADPDAEKTGAELRPQPTISNGTPHPDEIQNARYNLPSNPAQQQQIPISVMGQTQLPPSIVGSAFIATPTTLPIGTIHQQIVDGHMFAWEDGSAVTSVQSNVQHSAAPTVTPYGQQPLPQRSQQQQQQQQSQPPSVQIPPPPGTAPAAPMPSSQASESLSMNSLTITEPMQPPRPQSTEKESPVPSDDHEESADTGSTETTWASRVKNKTAPRSSYQAPPHHQQHPPMQHATQVPGPSAMLSPTPGAPTPMHGHLQQDFGNRPSAPQYSQHQPNRMPNQQQQFRQPRPPNPNYGPGGGGSQDARSSPAPSGHQMGFGGGGGGGGGGNRSNQHGLTPVDTAPPEQQVYIKNLPMDTTDNELKDCLEQLGYTGILEMRVRRKGTGGGPQQGPQQQACFAFVAFETSETARKLIQQKTVPFKNGDIAIDAKKIMDRDRPIGGGGGFSHNGSRPYNSSQATAGQGGMGRGGPNPRGGMNRGGGMANRGMGQGQGGGPGGYIGQGGGGGGGGGGNRQQQQGRIFHQSTGRGGGGGGGGGVQQHPQ